MKPLSDTDPTVVGSYRLLGVLGNGGMGRVYLGQSRSGRPVAIKVIRPDLVDDPLFRRRFVREVAAVRAVNPLYTAAVIDADTSAPAPWLATTYIEGPSLERWVDTHGALSPGAVLTLAAGLAEALASIHAAGLVHRDLKPSNVLLGDVGPYIIDFGVVLSPNATRMTSSLVVGTPSYMAPERIHGGEATPSTDVFSLGATMFYATTGSTLVDDSDTVYAQMMRIIKGRFDLARVPPELRPLVTRCLGAEARDRPTAAEISHLLAAAGVSAPAPGWHQDISDVPFSAVLTPLGRTRTSRRRLLLTAGFAGVAAVGGTAAGVIGRFAGNSTGDGHPAPPVPGSIVWQGSSGAQPIPSVPWGEPPTSGGDPPVPGSDPPVPGEVWIVAARSMLMVAATRDAVRASDPAGVRRWERPASDGPAALYRWDDTVLLADARRLLGLDLASGTELFRIEPAPAPGQPGGPVVRLAVAGDRAYIGGGAEAGCVAYGRDGREVWRRSDGGTPLAADTSWLLTHDRLDNQVRLSLRDAGSGEPRWTVAVPAPALVAPAPDPPPGDPPPGRSGGPPPGRPPGPPPDDRAWNRTQAVIGDEVVLVRDASDVRVLRLADGGVISAGTSPTPVADVALAGELVIVAADRVRARRVGAAELVWDAPAPGCRVVVVRGEQVLAATPEGRVWASDLAGTQLWQTELPGPVQTGLPHRLTVDGDQVLVTFAPPPGTQAGPGTVDVVALAV